MNNTSTIFCRLVLITIALLWLPSACLAQDVALSFDDGVDPRVQQLGPTWNASILEALAKARVSSIIFPAGKRVDSPAGLTLIRDWGNNGHAIGNHTYSHLNLCSDQVTLEQFIKDVEKNEALLKDMPGWTKRMRFPLLKQGDTLAKRDGFRAWLAEHGYKSGAVSIDASDWYYNSRYLAWRKRSPGAELSAFRAAYLNHLWDRSLYYDSLSQQLFGRSVRHVLLLHTNAINAEFLPDIIEMYRAKGWTIISPEEAYQDPVYAMQPTGLPAGESILWALAKQKGVTGLRYPAENDVYEKPLLDRLGL